MVTGQSVFTRKATGLVREVGLGDLFAFNLSSQGPVGAALLVSLFYVLATFPGTSVELGLLLTIIIVTPALITFSLLSAVMPRSGGDYVIVSRLLHPALGMVSNFAVFWSTALSAGLWAFWVPTVAIGPMLAIFGTLTNNPSMVTLSGQFTQPWVEFVTATAFLAVTSFIMALGTKLSMRILTILCLVGMFGFLVAIVPLITTSHQAFVQTFNQFAASYMKVPDPYNAIISTAKASGLTYMSTLPAIAGTFVTGTFVCGFAWWSTYIGGEIRHAQSIQRQLIAVVGAGWVQAAMLIVAAALILGVVGQDFMTSLYYLNTAAPTKYPFPFAPYYNFFAGLLAHNPLIAGIIVFAVLAFMYPGTYINVAMPVRCLFAWSIDRLLPDAVSSVNERTHTPIVAIVIAFIVGTIGVAWASFSATFFTVLGLVLFFSFVPVLFAGITGVFFPYRHPELYKSSGISRYQVFGLPLVSLTGALCILSMVYFAIIIVIFPQTTGGFPLWALTAVTVGIFVAGAVFYYVARYVRRRQGIDVELAYREIPPD